MSILTEAAETVFQDQPLRLPIVFVIVNAHHAGDDTPGGQFGQQACRVFAIGKRADPRATGEAPDFIAPPLKISSPPTGADKARLAQPRPRTCQPPTTRSASRRIVDQPTKRQSVGMPQKRPTLSLTLGGGIAADVPDSGTTIRHVIQHPLCLRTTYNRELVILPALQMKIAQTQVIIWSRSGSCPVEQPI